MGTTQLPPEIDWHVLQQYQAQMAQPQATSARLGGVLAGIGGAIGGWSTGSTNTDYQQEYQPITNQLPRGWKQGSRDYGVVNFYRINEPTHIQECMLADRNYIEPLDELRIKVAKWLYN